MILYLVLESVRHGSLTVFDTRIHELFDLAAVKTDDVIVMLPFIQFKDSGRAFEMMTSDEARGFKLGQHAIDSGKTDVFVGFEQMLINVFRAHVSRRCRAENLEDFDARQSDFEPGPTQIIGFHVPSSRFGICPGKGRGSGVPGESDQGVS